MSGQIHRTEVQMRFADTDALGHVNNATFATYAELGRLDFLQVFGTSVRSLILASIYLDFRRQVKLGETIHVETKVAKMGKTSVTLVQQIFANGELAADVSSTVVHFDYANGRARGLTDKMREALAPYI